jgi:restriction system protein
MTLWGIRSGKYGEREGLALRENLAVVGWENLPDLSTLGTRQDLKALLEATYPDVKAKALSNWESQLWPFMRVMEKDDPIVMPLKQRSGFALGRVKGPYRHEKHGDEFLHVRPVEWVREVRGNLAQEPSANLSAGRRGCASVRGANTTCAPQR